jgi:ribonuclease BN (tRNA processing enzyme)
MELRVLGCWAPYPAPDGACSGYLVGTDGSFILLDCGHGVVAKLLGSVQLEKLEAILISHWHPDHWHDLPALRHALRARTGQRQRNSTPRSSALPLYAPGKPREFFAQAAACEEAFAVQAVESLPAAPGRTVAEKRAYRVQLGAVTVDFHPTRHALPTYCIELSLGGKRVFYTSDTAWWDGLPGLASGADLLLAEASLLSVDRHLVPEDHLTATEAGRLAAVAGVKALLLTHLWPEYDPEQLRLEAQQQFHGRVLLASEVEACVF